MNIDDKSITKMTGSPRTRKYLFSFILAAVLLLFLFTGLELVARIIHQLQAMPRNGEQVETSLDYSDTWRKGGMGPGGFLREGFDNYVKDGYGGSVRWHNNAQGFRNDYEIKMHPGPETVRVLSLGDSFTAGYRLDQSETFSRLLEQGFNARDPDKRYEFLISCIEDPVNALGYLQTGGLQYQPRLVLLGITLGNDISQAYTWLGPSGQFVLDDTMDRLSINEHVERQALRQRISQMLVPQQYLFQTGTTSSRTEPFKALLEHSELYRRLYGVYSGESLQNGWPEAKQHPRLFSPTNSLGQYLKHPPEEVEQSFQYLFRTLRAIRKIVEESGADLLLVIFPQRFQVQEPDWQAEIRDYHLNPSWFDTDLPNRRILDFCAAEGFDCLDPTPGMRQNFEDTGATLYLPRGDMHWNAEGNRVLYHVIKEQIYLRLHRSRSNTLGDGN